MTSDLSIFRKICRVATLLINVYGRNARDEAAKRAKACLDEGDVGGHWVWLCIKEVVVELQREQLSEGELVH